MASNWTATLDDVKTDRGNVVATITFRHGVTNEAIVETLRADDLTDDRVAVFAYLKIRSLDARDASRVRLTKGQIIPQAPRVSVVP